MDANDTEQVVSDELFVTLLDYLKDDHTCEILATGFLVSENPDQIDIDVVKNLVSGYFDSFRPNQRLEESYQEFQKLFSLPVCMVLGGNSNDEDVYSCTYFLFQGTNKIVVMELSESKEIVGMYIEEPTDELRILKSNFSDSVPWC